jgi:hypothetical protein
MAMCMRRTPGRVFSVVAGLIGTGLAVALAAAPAHADPLLYNRSVAPSSITYQPDSSSVGGWLVSASFALSSNNPQNIDLGTALTLSVQTGTALPFFHHTEGAGIIIVGPGLTPHPPGTIAACDLFCVQTCLNPCCGQCFPIDTIMCVCVTADTGRPPTGQQLTVPFHVPVLHEGDTITLSASASSTAAPELDLTDDTASLTVALPACPAETPFRCADGRCVIAIADCAAPPCAPDFNHDGHLAVADIFAFLNAWFAGDAAANFDGINGLQVADIFAFLNAWFAGC